MLFSYPYFVSDIAKSKYKTINQHEWSFILTYKNLQDQKFKRISEKIVSNNKLR